MTPRPQATNSSLTEVAVRSIRLRHALGQASVRQLAAEFKLAAESVRKILRRETWAWVSDEGPGAPAEAWASAANPTDIEASKARFLAGLAEPTPQPEPRAENLLGELAGPGNKSGV